VQAPVINVVDLLITANNDPDECSATVAVPVPGVTENCPLAISPTGIRSDNQPLNSPYPVGSTTITWTITDANGNPATPVVQTVTVTDNQAPVITVAQNPINVNTDFNQCYATVFVPLAMVDENCPAGDPVGTRSDNLPLNAPYPVGQTTITWTITDASNNAAIPVEQVINVTDNQVPVIAAVLPINMPNVPGECYANITVPVPQRVQEVMAYY
jgi:hypothetical protein